MVTRRPARAPYKYCNYYYLLVAKDAERHWDVNLILCIIIMVMMIIIIIIIIIIRWKVVVDGVLAATQPDQCSPPSSLRLLLSLPREPAA